MDESKVVVHVSKDLYDLVKHRVEESDGEFKSVEDYVEFVLREVTNEERETPTYSQEEEEKIKERLKSLGYL